jgi:signal transduction histidine kinase
LWPGVKWKQVQPAFPAVLGAYPIATVVTQGEAHLIRYVNPAFLELAGVADPGLGFPITEQFPALAASALLEDVYRTGKPANLGRAYQHPERGNLLLTVNVWPCGSLVKPALTLIEYLEPSERAQRGSHPEELWRDLRDVNERLLVAGVRQDERAQETTRRLAQAEEAADRSERALRTSEMQTQSLARRLMTAQEEERIRIARELHDDVNQQLAGLSISLSLLRRALPSSLEAMRTDVATLQERTAAIIETIRGLSHELHPGSLRTSSLVSALRRLCVEVAPDIIVEFHPTGDLDNLPDDVTLTIYRITQEALRNVVRHARAPRADVFLIRDASGIQLQIIDDGCGFVNNDERGGLGLLSMQERALVVSGNLMIESLPDFGTRVSLRIPAASLVPRKERTTEVNLSMAQRSDSGPE